MDYYTPTNRIKWFRLEQGSETSETERPVVVVPRGFGGEPEPFVLRQLWTSCMVGEDDQWREIELVV
jgi:hypothetical protein